MVLLTDQQSTDLNEKKIPDSKHDSEDSFGISVESLGYDEQESQDRPVRGLSSRHIQFMAFGGCIGTGLFVGSGKVLAMAGPLSILLAYILVSTVVYGVTQALGEMTTWLPVPGAIQLFATRYINPATGFASGWNYYYGYVTVYCAEVSAAVTVIGYWIELNPAIWISIILCLMILINLLPVRVYGETEFWFSCIKVTTIVALLILTVVVDLGGAPNHHILGFQYWRNPGAMNTYLADGDLGRFSAFFNSLVMATYAFILSPEFICVAAGESQSPRRNIPKATKRFFYRIIFFYVLGVLAVGVLVPYTDPRLKMGSTGAASPFVIGMKDAGIRVLPHIINAVILVSAVSAGNSFMYSCSRTLMSLAEQGQAPQIFRRCNRYGTPYIAVLVSAAFGLLNYMNVSKGGATVFSWFVNLSTLSGLVAWAILLVAFLRFRAALKAQSISLASLPFRSRFQPWVSFYSLFWVLLVIVFNGYYCFFRGNFTAANFLTSYFGVFYFVALVGGYQLVKRTRFFTPAHEIDILTGKAEIDEMEANEKPPEEPKTFLGKVWQWIA
ncbi:proline specific permease [Schizosaccharomyces japonicus yFS275]|uniref:Proline specific permease n=1 Tax=Schizosaccharomyces japonicus (strain yFS275 / FY16936) TaxID=402676 RepID=B6K7K4_SCHJY|nr:proline specific permease [Schizosaccharomyces japonicus yFS275]EEB09508.1 proline specific permease [Schizosaccharomyces japonicus yFS275]